jgi:hypothetical protein
LCGVLWKSGRPSTAHRESRVNRGVEISK